MRSLVHFLEWFTGANNESGKWYGFWSGFGADFGELAIVGGLVTIVRHQNCGVHGCYRFGRHEYEMDGIRHKLCRKHHPGIDENHVFTAKEFAAHHDRTT